VGLRGGAKFKKFQGALSQTQHCDDEQDQVLATLLRWVFRLPVCLLSRCAAFTLTPNSHVILPMEVYKYMREMNLQGKILSEEECSMIGVTQSPGWEHYAFHKPEPNILLFRREKRSAH
jgi:hypothetical protein